MLNTIEELRSICTAAVINKSVYLFFFYIIYSSIVIKLVSPNYSEMNRVFSMQVLFLINSKMNLQSTDRRQWVLSFLSYERRHKKTFFSMCLAMSKQTLEGVQLPCRIYCRIGRLIVWPVS